MFYSLTNQPTSQLKVFLVWNDWSVLRVGCQATLQDVPNDWKTWNHRQLVEMPRVFNEDILQPKRCQDVRGPSKNLATKAAFLPKGAIFLVNCYVILTNWPAWRRQQASIKHSLRLHFEKVCFSSSRGDLDGATLIKVCEIKLNQCLRDQTSSRFERSNLHQDLGDQTSIEV